MAYSTRYSLTWAEKGCASLDKFIADFIADNEEMSYCLDDEGDSRDDGRWYEHEKDMRALSTAIPFVRFTLEGHGEESGDIWRKYFLAGKMQVAKIKLDFPPFDANLLT